MKTDTAPLFRDEVCNGYLMDKEGLVDAILEAWREDRNLSSCIFRAAMLNYNMRITPENWTNLFAKAHALFPLIHPESSGKQPVRAWIASHASNVGDALWSGNYDLAKRMFLGGRIKRTLMKTSRPSTEPKNVMTKESKGLVVVRARSLSKWHDWKTVK